MERFWIRSRPPSTQRMSSIAWVIGYM